MSAGSSATRANHDLQLVAPRFRAAVQAAIADCHAAGLDAFVHEAYRSAALQALYYARGRTVIPPSYTVTNARSNLYSWHGYGLAVDVISASRGWDVPRSWYDRTATIFKSHGLAWGGDWKMKDLPHFQWAACRPSPSDRAREILAVEGMQGVWTVVGAV